MPQAGRGQLALISHHDRGCKSKMRDGSLASGEGCSPAVDSALLLCVPAVQEEARVSPLLIRTLVLALG